MKSQEIKLQIQIIQKELIDLKKLLIKQEEQELAESKINQKIITFDVKDILEETTDYYVVSIDKNHTFNAPKTISIKEDELLKITVSTFYPQKCVNEDLETKFDYRNIESGKKMILKWNHALRYKRNRKYTNFESMNELFYAVNRSINWILDDDEILEHEKEMIKSANNFDFKREQKKQNKAYNEKINVII